MTSDFALKRSLAPIDFAITARRGWVITRQHKNRSTADIYGLCWGAIIEHAASIGGGAGKARLGSSTNRLKRGKNLKQPKGNAGELIGQQHQPDGPQHQPGDLLNLAQMAHEVFHQPMRGPEKEGK